MQENNVMKVAHVINLPTLNIKAQLNMNIDSNTHIKQVLNIETCLVEAQIEPLFNKAVVKGKIGTKVLYIDTDNMYSTMSDAINFSETITSENISADCEININNSQFIADFDYDNQSIKINIDGAIDCFCNLNAGFNAFNQTNQSLIAKKSVLQACNCVQKLNKNVNYDCDFKVDAKLNKILSCDSKVIIEDSKCYDGYIVVSGEILNTIMYETENEGLNFIKILNNSTPFKVEVEANSCDSECIADLSAYIDMNKTEIKLDIDSSSNIAFEFCIVVGGYVYKNVNMDIVEDLYSLENEIEIVNNNHSICKKLPYLKVSESVDTEITLADELNIDEILGMVNISANITQHTIKENMLVVEGVINGNLLYIDENKAIRNLPTQLPYSVNIKQEFNNDICAVHLDIVPTNCKCKIKRGNTLMVDYEVCITGNIYEQVQVNLIENVKYGKVINYGDIAFQIFVAHPNETKWQLCKRIHITEEQLTEFNKENPATYLGGEKIIVYR